MRKLLLALLASIIALPALRALRPAPTLDELGIKAERYFAQKEWASAAAMYSLMIDRRPDSAALYGRAVTAAAMRGLEGEQRMLLRQAVEAHVPLDSLFMAVQRSSFGLGQSSLLERFLILSAESEPWMARKIDAALLGYYTFRRNGAAMIQYADRLLKGLPESELFGLRLAQGYFIEGRNAEAVATWKSVLDRHPDSLEALLYLGEMARRSGDTAAAQSYFARANNLQPSPRLAAYLAPPEQ